MPAASATISVRPAERSPGGRYQKINMERIRGTREAIPYVHSCMECVRRINLPIGNRLQSWTS